MPEHPNNPQQPQRPMDASGVLVSDEQILDWVEGRLSADEAARLAALSGRAGLEQRVAQMQANRRALRAMGEEQAPPELMDRVLAALERETLLSLSEGEPLSHEPPISRVVPSSGRRRTPSWIMPLAMAASLVLLVGGVGYVALQSLKSDAPISSTGPVAILTAPEDPAAQPLTMATPDVGLAPAGSEGTQPAPEMMVAQAPAAPVSASEAMGLAREGRLVIRVLARDVRELDDVARLSPRDPSRSWRLTRELPAALAQAVLPEGASGSPARPSSPSAVAMGGAKAKLPALSLVGPGALFTFPGSLPPPMEPAAFLADLPDDPRALELLADVMSQRLKGQVVFEAATEAMPGVPTTQADQVVWWTRPPSTWTPRVSVPMVVEPR